LPGRPCLRCGAFGTHYLTCPGLRLPSGYRLVDAVGAEHRWTANHYLSLYDYIKYWTWRAGALEKPWRESRHDARYLDLTARPACLPAAGSSGWPPHCAEHGLPWDERGKLVVARDEAETKRLRRAFLAEAAATCPVITEQFLEAFGQVAGDRAGNGQAVVLLRAQLAGSGPMGWRLPATVSTSAGFGGALSCRHSH
jgi:hypothetical protein